MTFLVKFKPTNLQQKKPSICSTYLMYFLYKKNTLSGVFFWWTSQNVFANSRILPRPLYKKTPFRVCSFGGLPRTRLQRENPPRPLYKKTPFRVCSFGGLPRTRLQRENPPRPLHKKTPFRVCSFGGRGWIRTIEGSAGRFTV